MDRASTNADYHAKRERFDRDNARRRNAKKGIGLAAFLHGSGFTGSGERYLNSLAGVDVTAEGQGAGVWCRARSLVRERTRFSARLPRKRWALITTRWRWAPPDTSVVPNTGPTVASRTSMVVGKLVHSAALGLKKTLVASGLLQEAYTTSDFVTAARTILRNMERCAQISRYEAAAGRSLGRSEISRRGLCGVCVGGLCG